MAGISKAEREARAAAAAAAEQGGQLPQDTGDASNADADQAAALQAKAEAEARSAAEAEAAAAAAAQAVQLVPMVRDEATWPAPHTADVHPDEVGNFAAGGWVPA